MSFSTTLNGNTSTTVTETGVSSFQFNTVGLAYGFAGAAIATYDNVLVEVVPEPATFGLLCGMGGAVLFLRRRFVI